MANLLRFGRGVDNRLYKATGFAYGFTSREAVIRLGEHMRLEPILRGRARDEGYVYEREVEEFLRWSPHVRRERAVARASARTASRSESEAPDCIVGPNPAGIRERAPYTLKSPLARKLQIAVVFLVAILLLAAVGAYAWDSSRSDEIADGVTIGGVDVGGMNADEATKAVDTKLVKPLRKKVTVTYEGVKYQLSAEKLEVDSDVDGMVDRALEESQEGGLPTRVWRYATGGEVDVAIAPQVSYSSHGDRRVHHQGRRRGQPRRRSTRRSSRRPSRSRASPVTTGSRSTSRRCGGGSSPWSSAPTTARSRSRSTSCTRT